MLLGPCYGFHPWYNDYDIHLPLWTCLGWLRSESRGYPLERQSVFLFIEYFLWSICSLVSIVLTWVYHILLSQSFLFLIVLFYSFRLLNLQSKRFIHQVYGQVCPSPLEWIFPHSVFQVTPTRGVYILFTVTYLVFHTSYLDFFLLHQRKLLMRLFVWVTEETVTEVSGSLDHLFMYPQICLDLILNVPGPLYDGLLLHLLDLMTWQQSYSDCITILLVTLMKGTWSSDSFSSLT